MFLEIFVYLVILVKEKARKIKNYNRYKVFISSTSQILNSFYLPVVGGRGVNVVKGKVGTSMYISSLEYFFLNDLLSLHDFSKFLERAQHFFLYH